MQARTDAATSIDWSISTEARNARRAVTGPCTAEYGPLGAAKRNMLSVHSTATKDNSRVRRPDINMVGLFIIHHYISLCDIFVFMRHSSIVGDVRLEPGKNETGNICCCGPSLIA